MTWTWKLESNDAKELDQSAVPTFDDQAEAEAWVGDVWQDLLDQGVDAVTLMEGGEVIYASMSLHAEPE